MSNKSFFITITLYILVFLVLPACKNTDNQSKTEEPEYTVAAFYWPAYHYEPRAEFLFPEKTGEWEIIRNAVPKE